MSPTAAMVIRLCDWSGAGGSGAGSGTGAASAAGTTGTGSGVATGSGGGGAAQPATQISRAIGSRLLTEPDSQYVNLGLAQLRSDQVQFVEIIHRADSNPVVTFVVDGYMLDS